MRPGLFPFYFCKFLLLCTALSTQAVMGEPSEPVNASQTVTQDQAQAKIKEIEGTDQLEGPLKEQLLQLYQQAMESLNTAQAHASVTNTYKQAINSAPKKTIQLQKTLSKADDDTLSVEKLGLSEKTPLEALEQRLVEKQAELSVQEQNQTSLNEQLQYEQIRPAQAREQLAVAKQQQDITEEELNEAPSVNESPWLTEGRRFALTARLQAYKNEMGMLDQELLSHTVRSQLLTAQHDLAARQSGKARMRVKFLQDFIQNRRETEAQIAREQTARTEREAVGKDSIIRTLAEKDADLGRELSVLVANLERATATHRARDSQLKQLEQDLQKARQRLEVAGLNEALGHILRKQRLKLPNLRQYRKEAAERKNQIAKVGLAQFQIEERRHQLEDIDQAVAELMVKQHNFQLIDQQQTDIEAEVRALLTEQRKLLDKLGTTQAHYLRVLGDLEFIQKQLIETIRQFAEFLDEHLLWIPSARPLDAATLPELGRAFAWALSPQHWLETGKTLTLAIVESPLLAFIALLIFVAFIRARKELPVTLKATEERVTTLYGDRFGFTLEAFFATLLSAAPWPFLFAVVGWWLQSFTPASDFSDAVGIGFSAIALPLLLLEGFRLLCRTDGVASIHFGWHEHATRMWRRHLAWLIPIVIPALFVTAMAGSQAGEAFANSLGRGAFIVSMLSIAIFVQRVLRPNGGMPEPYLIRWPDSWRSRLRYIWYPAVVGIPLILVILAGTGYYYSSLQLKGELIATLRLLISAVLIKDMVIRWLTVTERKLALIQARDKREAERTAQAAKDATEASGEAVPATLHISAIDVETIDIHTRKLLNTLIGLTVAVGLWLIWKNVFPALGVLDHVTLWENTVVVGGKEILQPITLGNAAVAGLTALVVIIAARNLPGVLELAVLRKLPLDHGSRYAITNLARYAVAGIGIIMVFNAFGGNWSQIQWLVAALSVGLGFGLQEIFANFISGIIILFEQPIRVGDTVTVGDISGTVTRIRIRATTITDWDHKELVVPNKTFITDPLINWTLSDPITRVVVKTGIAYDSDTQLAHQVMLDAAKSIPLVLADPEPSVLFLGFGDSALDFEIRVFAKELADRLPLLHELHMAIEKTLREHGIEIPFPQRDIHVRSTVETNAMKSNSS